MSFRSHRVGPAENGKNKPPPNPLGRAFLGEVQMMEEIGGVDLAIAGGMPYLLEDS
jgi:hypothetical protein